MMKNKLMSFTVRAALFLFFACLVMVFITDRGSAERYVMIFSCVLILAFVSGIVLWGMIKKNKNR